MHLKLSPKKCSLFQKEVKYLEHIVSSRGISTDPEKVEAVQSWPTPRDSKEVHIDLLVFVPIIGSSFLILLILYILSISVQKSSIELLKLKRHSFN